MAGEEVLSVDLTSQADSLMLYPHKALVSSASANWNEFYLQYHRQPPYEMAEHSCRQHRIIIHDRTLQAPMLATIEEMTQPTPISSGTITVIPANSRNWACWDSEHQFIALAFESTLLAQHVAEAPGMRNVELTPTLSRPDPLIHSIGLALRTELESNGMEGSLYVNAMTTALMAHLLRHYSTQSQAFPTITSGLPKRKLQQVIDYIYEHLEQDLTLSELAAIVHISPSYFSGLFRQSTGLAPHQYMIQCRIDRAKHLLLKGELSIADVAQSLGFAHQSHLSRHFKRLVGVTPKAFLKRQ
ncbi:MAG: AraC family transcriptional regulator [Stenomitos rutilans HA7619-LM2]|jgi:AraC family transcriptional regulator|nr:AraC family transcriptional regulator [Stenomitos rutilans HA7619-LM2]